MKIAVVGAGGVGGYFGGLLARSGHDVCLLARGEHLQALRERGLKVQSLHGDFELPVRATDRPDEVGLVELVLFAVKSYDTRAAAEAIRPLVGPDTAILSLQNGVENEPELEQVFGPGRVLGGVTHIESTMGAPGLIVQTSPIRRITFGEMSGGRTARAEAIQRVLAEAGAECFLVDDVRLPLWEKFLFICAMGGTTSLTGRPIGDVVGCDETRELLLLVMREVEAVGRACGVPFDPEVVPRTMEFALKLPPGMKSSMQRDLERGHRLEVEALNGAVVRMGREAAVPTPANLAIYGCLKLWGGSSHEVRG